MTIFIDASTRASLTGYDGLKLAIGKWLERDDLDEVIPLLVTMAEARFNREIRSIQREVSIDLTDVTALPDDFDSIKHIWSTATPTRAIDEVALSDLHSRTRYAGEAPVFTILDGNIVIAPAPDPTISAHMVYMANIPPLGLSRQTNWLLKSNPDLYLLAALLHAEFYGWNDKRLPLIESYVSTTIDAVNMQAVRRRHGSSPLVARSPIYEPVRGAYRR